MESIVVPKSLLDKLYFTDVRPVFVQEWHQSPGSILTETLIPILSKYHVSCTDGKISVRINYHFTYFFTVVPSNSCVFLSCRPFVVNTTFLTRLVGVEVSSVSWLGQLRVGV